MALAGGAGRPVRGRPDLGQRSVRHTVAEPHEPLRPAAEDPHLEPGGEAVDHRDTDTVETARDLVGVLVEFTAGMQVGHDDLGGRDTFLVMDTDGDAASVVGHRARAVGVQAHGDRVTIAGERLVDRVIDDLIDHVMQAGAVIGIANVHSRTLAHGIEPAQYLDRLFVVGRIFAIGAIAFDAGGGLTERLVTSCCRSPRGGAVRANGV